MGRGAMRTGLVCLDQRRTSPTFDLPVDFCPSCKRELVYQWMLKVIVTDAVRLGVEKGTVR